MASHQCSRWFSSTNSIWSDDQFSIKISLVFDMSQRMRALLVIMPALLALGSLAISCTGDSSTATIGDKAPDFTLPNLDSESISLSDFSGKPVFINFWRINCSPCREEMPHLQAVYDESRGEDLVMLNINIGDSATSIKQFLQGSGLSIPVLLDTNITVARVYGIPGTPTAFFIDRDGLIQAKVIGPFPNKEAIESQLSAITP